MREILAQRGKISVFAMAGSGDDALRDFELNHDMDGFDLRGEAEKMSKNRRSDVVGQIAVDAGAFMRESGEIDEENVRLDDFDVRLRCETCAECGGESAIGFDGDDAAGALVRAGTGKEFGHFAVAGADFEPCGVWRGGKRLRDALAPRQAG